MFVAFVRRHLNLVFLWHKGRNFQAITGDYKLAASANFIRGISAGKLDSFRLDFVSVSDERGSVINDYLLSNYSGKQRRDRKTNSNKH